MCMKKIFSLLAIASASSLFAEGGAPAQNNLYSLLIWVGFAIFFFYFILYRPEQKRRKKAEDLRSSLKKGDKVTAMGIVGIVSKVQEDTVILKMVDGAKIEVLKGAISEVVPTTSEAVAQAETVSSS